MSKITIEKYEDKDKFVLELALIGFGIEVCNTEIEDVRVNEFIESHQDLIYLIKKEGVIIGFTSYIYKTYYGFIPDTLCQDFAYIHSKDRHGKAVHALAVFTLALCEANSLPLEQNYASEQAISFLHRGLGKTISTTQVYDLETVSTQLEKLNKRRT